jgi:hypothetical protein
MTTCHFNIRATFWCIRETTNGAFQVIDFYQNYSDQFHPAVGRVKLTKRTLFTQETTLADCFAAQAS